VKQSSKEISTSEMLALLQKDGAKAMDLLFTQHYTNLCRAVLRILKDQNLAEDITQEVFYELWKKKDRLNISTSFGAYLRRAAINKSLNYIRDQKMKFEDEADHPEIKSGATSATDMLEVQDLQGQIDEIIDGLPERCRVVFTLSRFEEMSYKEIATELDISVKTVENQISKALKVLREGLDEFL